jgi:NhaP-type Na+/H+ or K+/H+ antiporter
MQPILAVGIIIITGFIFGEIATNLKLPKITGYLTAGIILNPDVFHLIPVEISEHTDLVTNISLSFITFSVGGTLLYSAIKKLGKGILVITFLEAQFAYISVFVGFLVVAPLFLKIDGSSILGTFLPLALLTAALASPTDPSAALAIIHEYKAKGEVSSTIMGVSALDDVLGIINYSFAVVVAAVFSVRENLSTVSMIFDPLKIITGSILCGIVFGYALNFLTVFLKNKKENPGVLIVLILGLLSCCYGISSLLRLDELLATMVMGAVVVNFNISREKIFEMIERYTEDLIFIVFFTLSGMKLDFSTLPTTYVLIIIFFIFRTLGKYLGTYTGAVAAKSSDRVRKYVVGGLIPSGGITIGLALLIRQNPAFDPISGTILNVIIGSTVLHELLGPIVSKISLKKADEIN